MADVYVKNPEFEYGQRVLVSKETSLGQVRKFEGCVVKITKGHSVVQLSMDEDGFQSRPNRWLYGGIVESPEDRKGEEAYDLEAKQLTRV